MRGESQTASSIGVWPRFLALVALVFHWYIVSPCAAFLFADLGGALCSG